jgi:methionyl-tRNA formyltransferase
VSRGDAVLMPQPEDGATYARKIKPGEARILWDRNAERIDRQIRGLSPFPGAWFEAPGARGPVRVKALLSRVEAGRGQAGALLGDEMLIAGGSGAVRILRVQREGRAAAGAADFLRGFPIAAGARLA